MNLSKKFAILLVLFTIFSCSNKMKVTQNNKVNYDDLVFVQEYIPTQTQKIDLYIEDTVIHSNICIKQNGTVLIKDSIDRNPKFVVSTIKQKGDTVVNIQEKYISKKQDTIRLISYFPRLIIHDSSIINHYDFHDDWFYGFNYEIEYSNILNNLKEPIIKGTSRDTVIRIILPIEYSTNASSKEQVLYSAIRLRIDRGKGFLYHTEGQYDSLANFILTTNDSCILTEKALKKTIKYINKIDFERENHFTEIGIDAGINYLIEIKLNEKYYVFERALFNYYNKNKQLRTIYYSLTGLKSKHIDNK